MTTDVLIDLVNDAKTKIANKKVFTNEIRDEIRSYQFEISEESKEFEDLQMICEGLTKNGNAEKFYSKYYATIALQATKYFPGLSRNSATLLSTKLADRLLAHSKEEQLSFSICLWKSLSATLYLVSSLSQSLRHLRYASFRAAGSFHIPIPLVLRQVPQPTTEQLSPGMFKSTFL